MGDDDRDAFELAFETHKGENRDEESSESKEVIRIHAAGLDVLKDNKDDILKSLDVLEAPESPETGTPSIPITRAPSSTGTKRTAEDVDKPPGKAQKKKESNEDYVLELSNNIRLTVSAFKGRMRADIRRYYTDKTSGDLRPTQKGLSMDKDQFTKFLDAFDDLKAAVKEQKTDFFVEIGRHRRVSVSDFTGRCLIDLREYFQSTPESDLKPGKKGICFDIALLDTISSHITDITTAMK